MSANYLAVDKLSFKIHLKSNRRQKEKSEEPAQSAHVEQCGSRKTSCEVEDSLSSTNSLSLQSSTEKEDEM